MPYIKLMMNVWIVRIDRDLSVVTTLNPISSSRILLSALLKPVDSIATELDDSVTYNKKKWQLQLRHSITRFVNLREKLNSVL